VVTLAAVEASVRVAGFNATLYFATEASRPVASYQYRVTQPDWSTS
jgi:hypothetical protein